MGEEFKQAYNDMERIAEKNFNLVKDRLLSEEKMSLMERAKMMEIAKNAAKILKYAAEMKYGLSYPKIEL